MDFYKHWRLNAKGLCERDTTGDEYVETARISKQVMMDNGCYEGWTEAGNKCYLFEHQPTTYREAKKFCGERGGYLAEIESQQEYEAVMKLWRATQMNNTCGQQMKSWWIGLTDLSKEGKWVSGITGEKPKFTIWNGGKMIYLHVLVFENLILDEPNNFGGHVPGEDCAVAGLWSEEMGVF